MIRSSLVPRLLYRKNGEESGYEVTVEESEYEAKKECVRIWIKMIISE